MENSGAILIAEYHFTAILLLPFSNFNFWLLFSSSTNPTIDADHWNVDIVCILLEEEELHSVIFFRPLVNKNSARKIDTTAAGRAKVLPSTFFYKLC